MITLPITIGKKYVRRDGKTITALPSPEGYSPDLVCVAAPEEAGRWGRSAQEVLAYMSTGAVNSPQYKHPHDLVADAEGAPDAHIQCAFIEQYAQDWKACPHPWKMWQVFSAFEGWQDLEAHPLWLDYVQYRRKPETVSINGVTINAPMRKAPNDVIKAYRMTFHSVYEVNAYPGMALESFQGNDIFYTREDAEAARLAIVKALDPKR